MSKTAFASVGDLPLRHGEVLRQAQLAYVSHGTLARDGRNGVLLTHGYTSSHLFAQGGPASEGSWSSLVGPGRAVDTDRFFVVSSNMVGSSFGSTGPQSLDPATGRPYGPDFPRLTLGDIVAAQRRLVEALGVRQLAAVVGPSYGGFQAFTWGVEHSDFVRAIAPVTSAARGATSASQPHRHVVPEIFHVESIRAKLAADPAWNHGHYSPGALVDTMATLREKTLRHYGVETALSAQGIEPSERDAALRAIARTWAKVFDPHSLLVLADAATTFDVSSLLYRLRARVLLVLSTTDTLFPPTLAPPIMAALRAAGVDASYEELHSPHGHLASGVDAAKWAPALARLLASVE